MLIKVFGAAVQGIDATLITIEVNSSRGCMFYLVGLPDSAVKESHQRIISALQVNGYRMPTSNIVINMAPADIRKEGAAYDLPLAIGILAASEVIQSDKLERYLLMGELSLDGSLQPIKGALPIAIKARELGFEGMIVPQQNAHEAAVVNNLKVYGAGNIKEVIEFFNGTQELTPTLVNTREEFYSQQSNFDFDFAEVKGQENVKRALEVAASGSHNILLIGSPGRWPSRGLYTGLLDFGSFPKPRGHFRASLWCENPVTYAGTYPVYAHPKHPEHVFLSPDAWDIWNYDEGQNIRVVCYTNAPQARLLLNGRVVGEIKPYDEKTGIIYWDIPFRAGELRAEGCDKEGNALSSYSIRTSGRPYAIRATADRTILSGDRATAHITVEVVDEEGTVVKLGDNEITCTVEGAARLLGLEGSDNSDMSDYTDNRHRVYQRESA